MSVNHSARSGGIIASFQFSIFFYMKVCCVFSLEWPHQGDSNEYSQYFQYKKESHPKLYQICSYGIFFQGTQEGVWNSRSKWAISVGATVVPLYIQR